MSTKGKNQKETTPKPQKQSEDPQVRAARINQMGAVAIVLITVLIAPLVFRLMDERNEEEEHNQTPLATEVFVSTPSYTPTFNIDDPLPTSTEFPTQVSFTNTPPVSIIPPPSLTATSVSEVMNVVLTFSASEGKAPFPVNFSAKNSYLNQTDGTTLSCIEKNVCSYSWEVRTGGTPIYGSTTEGSVFSYKFEKKGEYVVIVFVCRGKACSYSSVSITAR